MDSIERSKNCEVKNCLKRVPCRNYEHRFLPPKNLRFTAINASNKLRNGLASFVRCCSFARTALAAQQDLFQVFSQDLFRICPKEAKRIEINV